MTGALLVVIGVLNSVVAVLLLIELRRMSTVPARTAVLRTHVKPLGL